MLLAYSMLRMDKGHTALPMEGGENPSCFFHFLKQFTAAFSRCKFDMAIKKTHQGRGDIGLGVWGIFLFFSFLYEGTK